MLVEGKTAEKNRINGSEGFKDHLTAVDGLSIVNLSPIGSEVIFYLVFEQQISISRAVNLVLFMNRKIFFKNHTRKRNGHLRNN